MAIIFLDGAFTKSILQYRKKKGGVSKEDTFNFSDSSTLEVNEHLVEFYFSIFSRVWHNTNGKTLIFIIWVKPILFFRCIDFDEGKTILIEKTT